MKEKNSFVLYTNYFEVLKDISDEDMGKIFKAILEYKATGKIKELPANLTLAFRFIKNQLDVDAEKYNEKCEKARENGQKGGRPKNDNKKPNGFLKNQEKPNGFFKKHNDNDNDNDNECVYNNEEKKSHTPKSEFKNFGSYGNVYLTKKQCGELECLTMNRQALTDLINELSENIACNKEKVFNEDYPEMHFIRLKKYWTNKRKQNPEVKHEYNPYL